MADYKKYKVGITVKEPWADNISYEQLDMTLFAVENGGDGCAYVALKPNIGVRPNQDPTTWIKATQRGQSIYDYCIEYGLFVGTEEEFAQDYADAVQAAKDAAASATHVEEEVSAAEQGRVSTENARVIAESQRASAEESRVSSEAQRSVNETGRVNAEDSRVVAENGRVVAESQRVSAESTRATNEESRRAEFGGMMRDAETAIGLVDTATTEAENVDATVDGMIVTITDRHGVSKSVNIGFDIYRTYGSVAAMNADAANVENGKFVMIATLDPTSTENAQLWVRNSNAATSQNPFTFISDLDQASSAAWADWMENQKPIIEADHTTAQADHTTAVSDHTNATNDHAVAGQDHTTAGTDHTQAVSDSTRAAQDHSVAEQDHTRAEGDHSTASTDHSTAQSDHTTAGTDHTTASSDHQSAVSDHGIAESDHGIAESDHTTAVNDHAAVEVYVDSLGAFDISAYHATGGVLAEYADLTAALGTNGANIPDALRKGGMSVKFVQSSDHNYVKFFCTAQNFTTDVTQWQGVDDEPKFGSKNLSESKDTYQLGLAMNEYEHFIALEPGSIDKNGRETESDTVLRSQNFISISVQPTITCKIDSVTHAVGLRYYDSSKAYLGTSYSSSAAYIRFIILNSNASDIPELVLTWNGVQFVAKKYKEVATKEEVSSLNSTVNSQGVDIDSLKNSVQVLEESMVNTTTVDTVDVCPEANKVFKVNSGTISVESVTDAWRYGIIPIDNVRHIKTASGASSSKIPAIAFLRTNEISQASFISEKYGTVDSSSGVIKIFDEDIVAPEGANYIAINYINGYASNCVVTSVSAYNLETFEEEIDDLDERVSALEDTIKKYVVKKSPSSGEYSTIYSALQAAQAGEIIEIHDGIYEENHLSIKKDMTLIGIGDVEIRGYQAASTSVSAIENISTLECNYGAVLRNLKITAQNMRYPIHADFSEGNALWDVENCTFIHYGNNEAYEYQVSLGAEGNPTGVVNACSAWGGGTKGGDVVKCHNCTFISTGRAFSAHNNIGDTFEQYGASHVSLDSCIMISQATDRDDSVYDYPAPLFVQSMDCPIDGCDVVLQNCKLNGYIVLQNAGGDGWSNRLKLFNCGKFKLCFNGYGSGKNPYIDGGQISTYATHYQKFPETDFINSFINRGNSAIAIGKAVKNANLGGVASYNDTNDDVFGVALEDIAVGETGKICVGGYLPMIYFDGIRTTVITEGNDIFVDGTGAFSTSGTKVAFKAVDNQNIQIV